MMFDNLRHRSRPATILVVDDDRNNRDLLEEELDLLGCLAVPAANGSEALSLLASRPVDLVLLDVMMPGIDGVEVLRRIKSDQDLRHLPVVMISALDDLASVVRCIELGADDYLPKPFDPILLKARVGAGLERKRWRDQEAEYLARIERQLEEIESERRRADTLLEVILPGPAVIELKAHGRFASKRFDDVAILFADIVDFTRYSDVHPAEQVVEQLDRLMQDCERIISESGLEKIKSIGDGVVATGNLLARCDDPVMAAVRCGFALVDAARNNPAQWRMRVGISCGPVVAGIVGRSKFAFDIWGDAVNVASRLSGLGGTSAVYLTGQAWGRVQDRCVGAPVGPVTLKGKGEVEIFRCESLASVPA